MATAEYHPRHSCETFAVVLAGGKGTRLYELTAEQCKPAIHFAGRHRLIDFALANLVRSHILDALVLTQYRPAALISHISAVWDRRFSARGGRISTRDAAELAQPYLGTADAVYQNIYRIDAANPDYVLVLGADHVYDMNYGPMIAAHKASGAAATVAADIVPRHEASGFGVIKAGPDGRATDFLEKPDNPPGMADAPDFALASMGIYVFSWPWLRQWLLRDAKSLTSTHDFGHDLLPVAMRAGELNVHRFSDVHAKAYWRDVGTLDSYREAALAFAKSSRPCRLPHEQTALPDEPSVPDAEGGIGDNVVMPGAYIAPGARLRNAIVAEGALVPSRLVVGEDRIEDARWFRVTPQGTVLITKRMLERWKCERGLFHASRSLPTVIFPGETAPALK